MQELIKIENNKIITSEEVKQLFIKQQEVEALQKNLDKQMKAFKKEVMEQMKDNGIDRAEIYLNDDESVFLTYVGPTTRISVDTEEMKKDGIYEMYTKESPVKESLRIRVGERKED